MRHPLFAALAVIGALLCGAAFAQPLSFTYQGRLLDSNGVPITAPTTVGFSIWRGGTVGAADSGTMIHREATVVTPDSTGIFTHLVGTGTSTFVLDDEDFQTGTALFLQVNVPDGGQPLIPRAQIVSVPYALVARTLDRGQEVIPVPILTGGVLFGAGIDPTEVNPDVHGLRLDDLNNRVVADATVPLTWDNGAATLRLSAEVRNTLSAIPSERSVVLSFRLHGAESGASITFEGTHTFSTNGTETFTLPVAASTGTLTPGEIASWTFERRYNLPADTMPNGIHVLGAQLRLNTTR
jgi:hypothetical protein